MAVVILGAVSPSIAGDGIMGDWQGRFVDPPSTYRFVQPKCVAQVIDHGQDLYRIHLSIAFDSRTPKYFDVEAKRENGVVSFETETEKGTISDGVFKGAIIHGEEWVDFELRPVARKSPTLGSKAPNYGVTLFDGSNFDHWKHLEHDNPVLWKLVGDAMEVVTKEPGQKNNKLGTKRKFKDMYLHLEFRTPLMPNKRGQGRGNSGVYFMSAYETQVLDSYGLDGLWDEAGAIYRVSPPKVNACLPPLQWQTYDVEFHAPRFDESGKKIRNAVITAYLNGVRVHHQQEVHKTTHAGLREDPRDPQPLWLQDHGDAVQYRNIWAVDLMDHPEMTIEDIAPVLK